MSSQKRAFEMAVESIPDKVKPTLFERFLKETESPNPRTQLFSLSIFKTISIIFIIGARKKETWAEWLRNVLNADQADGYAELMEQFRNENFHLLLECFKKQNLPMFRTLLEILKAVQEEDVGQSAEEQVAPQLKALGYVENHANIISFGHQTSFQKFLLAPNMAADADAVEFVQEMRDILKPPCVVQYFNEIKV